MTEIKICNLCGGKVDYILNYIIYGKSYGSGWAYRCRSCGAFTCTHKLSPKEPLGILADKEMRELRKQCHEIFDTQWKNKEERTQAYKDLAKALDIPIEDCHFAMMDKYMLKNALLVLQGGIQ